MTILARLEEWKEQGIVSPEQHALLAGLARGEPFSVFLELNVLLYAGILAFVAGLGWTVSTWSQQLGNVARADHPLRDARRLFLVLLLPRARLVALGNAFPQPGLRLRALPRQPHLVRGTRLPGESVSSALRTMGPLSAGDRRPVLLSGLSFRQPLRLVARVVRTRRMVGLHISHWPSHQDAEYRQYAILYSLIIGGGGTTSSARPESLISSAPISISRSTFCFGHCFLAGFRTARAAGWCLCLLAACGASLAGV